MQLSEPMPRIPKIVSKLALVLLIISISGSRVVIKSILQFSEPGNRIHKIVSKLALVLLLNTYERFRSSNRSVLCSLWNPSPVFENHIISNVTEYLHPVPISIQSTFCNFRNKTLFLNSTSKIPCTQKEEPH